MTVLKLKAVTDCVSRKYSYCVYFCFFLLFCLPLLFYFFLFVAKQIRKTKTQWIQYLDYKSYVIIQLFKGISCSCVQQQPKRHSPIFTLLYQKFFEEHIQSNYQEIFRSLIEICLVAHGNHKCVLINLNHALL